VRQWQNRNGLSMNVVLVTEGARFDAGGLGLVAVPQLAQALANLGHKLVLEMFGSPIFGSDHLVTTEQDAAWRKPLVAYSYPGVGRYEYSHKGLASVLQHTAQADFVILHSLYSFAVLSGYLAAERYRKKYAVRPHGVLAPFQRTVSRRKKAIYDKLIARRILDRAAVVMYTAEGERDETAPLSLTAPSVIIPNGIDLEPFTHMPPRGAFRAKYLKGFQGPLVLYLGRLNAKKGLDVLIHAMAQVRTRIPDAHLAVVGAGDPPEFNDQVKTWIRRARLEDTITLTGLLTGQEKIQAFADTDVYALPSHAENFSFSTFEAMAAHVPVIISESLNFASEIASRGAGCSVERTSHAFAQVITDILESPVIRRTMGERGAELAEYYSWQRAGKQIELAIETVLANQSLPRELTR
jgi:glycosyltransferase involved in cell wall biosynthesis